MQTIMDMERLWLTLSDKDKSWAAKKEESKDKTY